jgi:hypothetical protein
LAALAPDVILAHGESTVAPLLQATRSVPIVFPIVADPVAAGFVDSLARPGGNATGFNVWEYSLGGKWLELLKEIAPIVTRAAVLRDPAVPSGTGQFGAIQAVAPSLKVEVNPVRMRDAGEIERTVAMFARSPNGGLILTGSNSATVHRDLIIKLAARHKLPAVYYDRLFVAAGGLISYGPDMVDHRRARCQLRDRILEPELVINLKPRRRSASKCRRPCSPAPTGDRMMRRRELSRCSAAQRLGRSWRRDSNRQCPVGVLVPADPEPFWSAFRAGLRERGTSRDKILRSVPLGRGQARASARAG